MVPMRKIPTIDDLPLVGNHPALNLTNTAAWSGGRATSDRLDDYSTLVRWGRRAGVIESKQATALQIRALAHPQQALRTLRRIRAFRQALHDVFAAHACERSASADALERLNIHIIAALTHARLGKAGATGALSWTWVASDSLDRVLWPVAQSAADLLTSADRMARVRLCAGESCGWLFLDNSKRGARRWCRMSECGNRAKVRRFRARQS
jgi:predicted RNA-binding Zn ribbon-like protein